MCACVWTKPKPERYRGDKTKDKKMSRAFSVASVMFAAHRSKMTRGFRGFGIFKQLRGFVFLNFLDIFRTGACVRECKIYVCVSASVKNIVHRFSWATHIDEVSVKWRGRSNQTSLVAAREEEHRR